MGCEVGGKQFCLQFFLLQSHLDSCSSREKGKKNITNILVLEASDGLTMKYYLPACEHNI